MIYTSWSLFWAFFYRDLIVFGRRWYYYALNYALIYPVNYIITECLITPRAVMQHADQMNTFMISLLTGNVMLLMISLSFNLLSPMIYDIERTRSIDFIITRIRPSLLILQRILFTACWMFLFLSPFFCMSKLLLGAQLDTALTNWPALLGIQAASALMIASYMICALSLLQSSRQFGTLWVRINIPLFVLGGFWAPWHIMYQTSKLLGALTLCNPMLYVTEGLRAALTGSDLYINIPACFAALATFSLIFYLIACRALRTKLDPVE